MKLRIILLLVVSVLFSGCFETDYVYLGDRDNNRIIKINIDTMRVVGKFKSKGEDPYEIKSKNSKIYILNRDDYNMAIINFKGIFGKEKVQKVIDLPNKPRSISFNEDKFMLSSTSDASIMLLDINNTNKIKLFTDGESNDINYGGTYKSAHPTWIDKENFILSDRSESALELYNINNDSPISKLMLKSSVHHLEFYNGYYYGAIEGKNDSDVSPGIVKFHINNNKILLDKIVYFSEFNLFDDNIFNKSTWGGHHLAINKSTGNLYMGSKEGNVFILKSDNLSLVDTFKAGKGAGHIMFTPKYAIITNHYSSFKTFYNLNTKKIKNIHTNKFLDNGKYLQSHSSWIKNGMLYFIASTDNKFVKIDLNKMQVVKKIKLPRKSYCLIGTRVTQVIKK